MRQRVAIAIALLHRPELIVADEPTTALDVTIQAQILSEVQQLCAETGTALIWITHDLSVVAGLADRIAVMYAGRIVETGPVDARAGRAAASLHARADRLRAQPQPRAAQPLAQIPGMTPSLLNLPPGCAFAPRCPRADAACEQEPPDADRRAGRPRLPLLPPAGRRGGRRMTRADHRAATASPSASCSGVGPGRRVRRRCSAPALRDQVVRAVDGVDLDPSRRRGGGAGRRVRLRQVHAGPHGGRHHAADGGRRCCTAARTSQRWTGRGGARRDAARPDDLPGPVCRRSIRACGSRRSSARRRWCTAW